MLLSSMQIGIKGSKFYDFIHFKLEAQQIKSYMTHKQLTRFLRPCCSHKVGYKWRTSHLRPNLDSLLFYIITSY